MTSVCFESSNVLTNQVSASSETSVEDNVNQSITSVTSQPTIVTNIVQPVVPNPVQTISEKIEQPSLPAKSIAKLVVTNAMPSTGSVLQKVVNPPLITVLNPSGPLTVVKTLCVTSGVSSAPQFTLVNSAPLNVTNTIGKSATITLLNAPLTVVKAMTTPQTTEKNISEVTNPTNNSNNAASTPTVIENRAHNVFVKNTCPDSTVMDIPQSHKLLTTNSFPQSNIVANSGSKTLNGQRNKLKIVSNVVVPGTSQTNNVLVNKSNQQRYIPRQKVIGPNGATTKYLNKSSSSNFVKPNVNAPIKLLPDKSPTRLAYPTHKSQIKTIPPMNNYMQKQQSNLKISPQNKTIPGQVTRTGSGLRTIPPQKTHKIPNKPNYIGKHAVQAQKMRQTHGKVKGIKVSSNVPYNVHVPPMPEKHLSELTFNQALTAQILETLSNSSTTGQNRYDMMPSRYDNAFTCPDIKATSEPCKPVEETSKSGLDALSLICQAVLLDHNYNATLPPDSPTRPSAAVNISSQVNGISSPLYSPGSSKRRLPSSSTVTSPPPTASMSNIPMASVTNSLMPIRDDDAGSDISDESERKNDTEGEETDTAPEAEAVTNENFEGYGDYVTRCICGFIHDDGYMVECDKCKVWQHVQCVVKNRQIPDEYLCEECDPSKPIDRQKARVIQQQWLRDRQLMDPKLRKDTKIKEAFKPKETVSDSDSSDAEHVPSNFPPKSRVLANRRKLENHPKQSAARQRREVGKELGQKRQKRKERKIVRKKPKPQVKNHSDDENQDSWVAHLPQLRQWIEKYEEAVTNHYSPELRARISSIRVNGIHSDSNIQFDSTVHKCRVHTQPLTEIKYLVATVNLAPNTPVVELRGKYMLSTQHRNSGGSLTTRQHSQRPGPFLFFYRLHKDNTEVCVDTRTYGNSARFIRRSCKPNAELRHCIEKGVLHIYVVSTMSVDKNCELTIKHESHDLAAVGTTSIACACGNPLECSVNNSSVKKNGETQEVPVRKRRGRRIVSASLPEPDPPKPLKEEPPPIASPPPAPLSPVKQEKREVKEEVPEVKIEVEELPVVKDEPKVEVKVEVEVKEHFDKKDVIIEEESEDPESMEKTQEEEIKSPSPTPVSTRRSSHKSDKEEDKCSSPKEDKKEKCKKLSREERKLEAILKAIEKMEKAESRKQEHQAKQAHRRESEPNPEKKEEEKQEPKLKRRRRKGRARTISQSASRRNRLNSTDSYMTTSGDENLLSPTDGQPPVKPISKDSEGTDNRAVGLLLALSNGDNDNKEQKSPARDIDSNSNSMHSSPETPLSSACLLVQAAVEPLEQGFKFPKTKKGLMNEWLNKVPEPVQTASAISPTSLASQANSIDVESASGVYGTSKNLISFCDNNIQPRGSAKKRWLRQAISEDHSCDSASGRPDSPPISDMVAPPKKRRLPRESISTDNSPPTTPTGSAPVSISNMDKEVKTPEGCVEIVYTGADSDSPTQAMESDAVLKERAAVMKQEFSKPLFSTSLDLPRSEFGSLSSLDPRLSRENRFLPNTDLVGTVEKTLSILGLENTEKCRPDPVLPKRKVKLSITEYRQRKKLNVEEKSEEQEVVSTEENNSSESFKVVPRLRSASASSSTSLTSSDDDISTSDIVVKAPVFNSEPTELELQRETSSLRLKKAFGLSVDLEPPPTLNLKAILNLDLEPKVKPVHNQQIPLEESSEVTVETVVSDVKVPISPDIPALPESPIPIANPPAPDVSSNTEELMETDEISVTDPEPLNTTDEKESDSKETAPLNMFYTPDEEDVVETSAKEEPLVTFEETESVSYVPPFNNPVYPNSSFATFSSSIDDDARYEGRNPSPPPNLDELAQS
ncbi:uncharacterized protein LOC130898292 isoform X1 [Diorhabda carinulata]|uniref:uncharacterized protein LOC130898292 isoform X1 n=1 Tax=Diorhabda carinulata TaxID=1163345 RepID=UPI0025A26C17|nr:uncharacterized protein LOC130898292 isoform X1 [Diorhabda carinulata]